MRATARCACCPAHIIAAGGPRRRRRRFGLSAAARHVRQQHAAAARLHLAIVHFGLAWISARAKGALRAASGAAERQGEGFGRKLRVCKPAAALRGQSGEPQNQPRGTAKFRSPFLATNFGRHLRRCLHTALRAHVEKSPASVSQRTFGRLRRSLRPAFSVFVKEFRNGTHHSRVGSLLLLAICSPAFAQQAPALEITQT